MPARFILFSGAIVSIWASRGTHARKRKEPEHGC
jgi:hypothetical protein